jgi:hypothetical protein
MASHGVVGGVQQAILVPADIYMGLVGGIGRMVDGEVADFRREAGPGEYFGDFFPEGVRLPNAARIEGGILGREPLRSFQPEGHTTKI